jgi:hypothetical protein
MVGKTLRYFSEKYTKILNPEIIQPRNDSALEIIKLFSSSNISAADNTLETKTGLVSLCCDIQSGYELRLVFNELP